MQTIEVLNPLILASASTPRSRLLDNVGIKHLCDPAKIDEKNIKESLGKELATPVQVAETLAELKAQHVSIRHNGCFVIGADQVLECDGIIYDKPGGLERARLDLAALRGRVHRLVTSVVIVRDRTLLWHHTDISSLTMRQFSDRFLDYYLEHYIEEAFDSVGGYQLESRGAQLFERVDGDYFSILGLPLLPLIEFLRVNGVVKR